MTRLGALLMCTLSGWYVALGDEAPKQGPPLGVSINGKLTAKEDILSGAETMKTGDYIVGTVQDTKAALLKRMETELSWTPKTNYASNDMFHGELTNEEIKWLLTKPDVTFIEADSEVSASGGISMGGDMGGISMGGDMSNGGDKKGDDEHKAGGSPAGEAPERGPPLGVKCHGTLHPTEDIKSGKYPLRSGGFNVLVVNGTKEALLQKMQEKLGWTPKNVYSWPAFTGDLTKGLVLWLMEQEEVREVETDGMVSITSEEEKGEVGETPETGPPVGVSINNKMYLKAEIMADKYEIDEGSFIVGVVAENKTALLSVMETELQWTPMMRYSDAFPMFAGVLNTEQVKWLLERQEVTYIENDGIISINEKKNTVIDGGFAAVPTGLLLFLLPAAALLSAL